MGRKKNDATLSKLGDIYQYFVALLDCFRMKTGDKIQIEVRGDVSLISDSNSSFQKEVKHHTASTKLSDRDIDLWNTLKNWVLDYSDNMKFNQLILFTTADIVKTSVFYNWNEKEKVDKYNILHEIGKHIKPKEKKFRTCYNDVFYSESITKEQIYDLLDKFQIEQLQPQIQGISTRFSTYLITIPKANRDNYIAALLGIVVKQVVNPPHKWEVSFEDFQQYVQTLAPSFMKEEKVPLPQEFMLIEPDCTEYTIAKEKTFVRALEDIKYHKIIPHAISDYWKTTKTIVRYFSDNISYTQNLTAYKESLSTRMFYAKETVLNAKDFSERSQELIASRKLCSDILGWGANDFGSIVANQQFFQNGMIHNIVDDKDFTWDVGEEDEH